MLQLKHCRSFFPEAFTFSLCLDTVVTVHVVTAQDEFHSRLRFNRRGLVGCASNGRNDNTSQFFFTLDRAEELNNKHTLFGKVGFQSRAETVALVDEDVCSAVSNPQSPVRTACSARALAPWQASYILLVWLCSILSM